MMIDLLSHVHSFFDRVRSGEVEIYNEFSLQHELGIHLRQCAAGSGLKIQFERPASFFLPSCGRLTKKEIDIAVFTPDRLERTAIELKFPRSGQYPEQMFKACQDVGFLEQLVEAGFSTGCFVMVVDDRLFYEGTDLGGVYAPFRGRMPLCGTILKPTGTKDEQTTIRGRYFFQWKPARPFHCAVIVVSGSDGRME
jgi:hypothetical protein